MKILGVLRGFAIFFNYEKLSVLLASKITRNLAKTIIKSSRAHQPMRQLFSFHQALLLCLLKLPRIPPIMRGNQMREWIAGDILNACHFSFVQ
jgi:hypothetical protein